MKTTLGTGKKPVVFIGSSSEAESIANAIEINLCREFSPRVWRTTFAISQTYLDSLLEVLDRSDFAVLVLAPDDVQRSRGVESAAVRDNVLFEAGLAIGRLGIERTFLVTPETRPPSLASDLSGIHVGTYDQSRKDDDADSAVRPFCTQIARLMKGLRARPASSTALARMQRLVAARGDADLLLHTFSGQDALPAELNAEAVLLGRDKIFRLWADAERGSSIRAVLAEADSTRVVRINFRNERHGLPGDITIRPLGDRAIAVPHGCRSIVFAVRAPENAEDNVESRARGDFAAIAVRVIDAQATQWCYQNRDTRCMVEVPVSDTWRDVVVDLEGPWVRFDSDGNYRYATERPDFSVLSAIVLEVGSTDASRPGPGKGEIEVAHIRLGKTPPLNS